MMSWEYLTIELELFIIIGFLIFFLFAFREIKKRIKESKDEVLDTFRELTVQSFKYYKEANDKNKDD